MCYHEESVHFSIAHWCTSYYAIVVAAATQIKQGTHPMADHVVALFIVLHVQLDSVRGNNSTNRRTNLAYMCLIVSLSMFLLLGKATKICMVYLITIVLFI